MLGYIHDLGFKVESSDQIVARLYEDPNIQKQLFEEFLIPLPITRDAVREELSRRPEIRHSLNRIFHVRVLESILESKASVVEVPLLFEACLQVHFERIWVVTCGLEEQWQRLLQRYGDEVFASRMLNSQLPTRAKCAFADTIIRTNRSEADVLDCTARCIRQEFI